MENMLSSPSSSHAFVLTPSPNHSEMIADLVLESYDEGIPDFLEHDLARLYRSVHSSLPQFRIHGGAENARVYVAHSAGRVVSALIYRIDGRQAVVINQCFVLDDAELSLFAAYIFKRFPQVDAIACRIVESRLHSIRYPLQVYQCSEDYVLKLPATIEEYHAQLGKSTRSYVNRYLNKLRRLHPTFIFEVHTGSDIRGEDVVAVFDMNRQRMSERGTYYGYSADYPERTTQLLRESGVLCLARINGEICAGTILYEVEGEYFLDVLSHRSEYNDIGLGTLCCYLSICECIKRGGSVYHFLWGRYDYKLRLGGVERPMSAVTLYRSRMHMLLRLDIALTQAGQGAMFKSKRRIREFSEREGVLSRLVGKLLSSGRRMRAEA